MKRGRRREATALVAFLASGYFEVDEEVSLDEPEPVLLCFFFDECFFVVFFVVVEEDEGELADVSDEPAEPLMPEPVPWLVSEPMEPLMPEPVPWLVSEPMEPLIPEPVVPEPVEPLMLPEPVDPLDSVLVVFFSVLVLLLPVCAWAWLATKTIPAAARPRPQPVYLMCVPLIRFRWFRRRAPGSPLRCASRTLPFLASSKGSDVIRERHRGRCQTGLIPERTSRILQEEEPMSLDPRQTLESLREAIRHIEGRRPESTRVVPTGKTRVDGLLPGGGLPRGALSELTGGRASGKTAVALSALATAMGTKGLAAFVDGRHELYPPAAAAAGIALDRLLVVRPVAPTPVDACKSGLWAAEALLASGGFQGVAIDVPVEILARQGGAAAMVEAMLRRVRAAAEKGGSLALWLSAESAPRLPSAVRLEFSTTEEGWRVHRAHARTMIVEGERERPATAVVPHAA